jgi:hypothetical protein
VFLNSGESGIDFVCVGDIALHTEKLWWRRGRVIRNGNSVAKFSKSFGTRKTDAP